MLRIIFEVALLAIFLGGLIFAVIGWYEKHVPEATYNLLFSLVMLVFLIYLEVGKKND